MSMRAVVLNGGGSAEIKQVPIPELDEGWILITPVSSGLCGTDLHILSGEFSGASYPLVPGHEFAGHVVDVGKGVVGFKEGDWVGVNPNISCGECSPCLQGATNLCESLRALGISMNGAMAEFVAAPESCTVLLDSKVSEIQGPLVEPLSCVLHALERVPHWHGHDMVIFGAGTIGLVGTVLAKAEGAKSITMIEPNKSRHKIAFELGCSAVVSGVEELDHPHFDLALDASGNPKAIESAIRVLRKRGRLIQMGVANVEASVSFNPYAIYEKEISITGSNSLAGKYQEACERMLELGDDLKKLVTGVFKFEDINQAIEEMRAGKHIKVLIQK